MRNSNIHPQQLGNRFVLLLIILFVVAITGCSTTVGNSSGLITTEIYPINSQPNQFRKVENSVGHYQQLAQQMVREGHSSFLIYMSFNAYIGIDDQDRGAALKQLSNQLCYGPDYATDVRSSTNHSGNYLNPGRHGINHIEAIITCVGTQRRMVESQRLQQSEAIERQRLEQSRIADEKARLKAEEEKRDLAVSQASRESTCKSFGFKPGTDFFSSCLFELYKIEQQARQSEALIAERKAQNRNQEAAQLEALSLQRQMLEDQRFSEGIRQMQDAAKMFNPPRTSTRCKWNPIANTMVCN